MQNIKAHNAEYKQEIAAKMHGCARNRTKIHFTMSYFVG